MSRKFVRSWAVVTTMIVFSGCGKKAIDVEDAVIKTRKKLSPVSGVVLVDGKPLPDVLVHFYSMDGTEVATLGQTDENGAFKMSTYHPGDGSPQGEYRVTFEKLRFRKSTGAWVGPDQLKNLYSDPRKSEFKLQIPAQPVKDLKYELKVAGR